MIHNKLAPKQKKNMKVRIRSGLILAVYGAIAMMLFAFGDFKSDGWISGLIANGDLRRNISFMCAMLSVLVVLPLNWFFANELHNCFLKTHNKKTIYLILILLTLTQLISTIIWMLPNYYGDIFLNGKTNLDGFQNWNGDKQLSWIWLISFIFIGAVLILISVAIAIAIVKKGYKKNKFNLIMFPFLIAFINIAMISIFYLSLVRYWTTLFLLFAAAFGTDIFAYFSGVTLGKHKIAPKISPKKSWEGTIIGTILASLLVLLILYVFQYVSTSRNSMDMSFNFFGVQFHEISSYDKQWWWWIILTLLAILLTIAAVFGDLLFSWVKRKNKIKDFGSSIAGHGGFLDRADALFTIIFIFGAFTFFSSIFTTIWNVFNHDVSAFNALFPLWLGA